MTLPPATGPSFVVRCLRALFDAHCCTNVLLHLSSREICLCDVPCAAAPPLPRQVLRAPAMPTAEHHPALSDRLPQMVL